MSHVGAPRLPFLTRVLPGVAIAGFLIMLPCIDVDPDESVASAEKLEAESIARCGGDPVCRLAYGASARVGADLEDPAGR